MGGGNPDLRLSMHPRSPAPCPIAHHRIRIYPPAPPTFKCSPPPPLQLALQHWARHQQLAPLHVRQQQAAPRSVSSNVRAKPYAPIDHNAAPPIQAEWQAKPDQGGEEDGCVPAHTGVTTHQVIPNPQSQSPHTGAQTGALNLKP